MKSNELYITNSHLKDKPVEDITYTMWYEGEENDKIRFLWSSLFHASTDELHKPGWVWRYYGMVPPETVFCPEIGEGKGENRVFVLWFIDNDNKVLPFLNGEYIKIVQIDIIRKNPFLDKKKYEEYRSPYGLTVTFLKKDGSLEEGFIQDNYNYVIYYKID